MPKKKRAREKTDAGPGDRPIPRVWERGEELPVSYANQVLVSHGGEEFYVVFGQTFSPHVTSREEIRKVDKVFIKPVARLAISHSGMVQILEALNKNVAGFMKKVQQTDADNAD